METVAVWLAFAITVACNAAFEALRLNGTTVAEVSSQVFAWFSPAPYAFFIWGVIYAAMAVWLVYFTFDVPKRSSAFGFQALMFVASCVLNVTWLALFHFELIGMALVAIIALWAVLFAAYYTARRSSLFSPLSSSSSRSESFSSAVAWVPWSIYVSWITVATVVNAVNLITRVTDGGELLLNQASVVVLTAAVLAAAYAVRRLMEDPVYPLVVLRAVIAVGVRLLPIAPTLAGAVFVMAGLAALAIYVPFERYFARAPRRVAP